MISVAMATHNGERYIAEQISSILCQLSESDELVISDDGSTDATLDVIASFGSPQIRLLRLSPDRSLRLPERVGRNFANALEQCRGSVVFIADQDDVWLRHKVQTMVAALQEADVAISDSWIVGSDDNCSRLRYGRSSPLGNYLLLGRAKYQGCCMALRREALRRMLPMPSRMPLYDSYLGLLGELTGRVSYIAEPLILHRLHHANASQSVRNPLLYKLSYRLRLLAQIYRRAIEYRFKQLKP